MTTSVESFSIYCVNRQVDLPDSHGVFCRSNISRYRIGETICIGAKSGLICLICFGLTCDDT